MTRLQLFCAGIATVMLPWLAAAGTYPFIVWDGHRFARSAVDHRRDVRYFRDLGFTHSLITAQVAGAAADAERLAPLFAACRDHSLTAGLRFGWDFSVLTAPWPDMVARGMTLRAQAAGDQTDYNPLHPEVIRPVAAAYAAAVDAYRRHDPGAALQLFLLGSERTWGLPKAGDVPPAAAAVVIAAAQTDGVAVASPADWAALGGWWAGPDQHGRDYRLRAAFEAAVREHLPRADFMVDPIWAVKIVNGFGGTWSYIGQYPLGIADGVLRIKAMCWPAPAAHSTQLIRGAQRDLLLEANLLSLCLGIDKLYHWGVHTIEPGHDPYYRFEGQRSPPGFPRFDRGQIADWQALLARLGNRDAGPLLAVWQALPEPARQVIDNQALSLENETLSNDDQDAIVAGLNAYLTVAQPVDPSLSPRLKILHQRGDAASREEMNRIYLEALLPDGLKRTASPNVFELQEQIAAARLEKEPALRATGRLLRDRGELFTTWQPYGPRLAVLGGVYGPADLYLALLLGHQPFDILRNPQHRQTLSRYDAVLLQSTVIDDDLQAQLQTIGGRGGAILLPQGFQQPAGSAPLAGLQVFDEGLLGKKIGSNKGIAWPGSPAELRDYLHQSARRWRQQLQSAGFRPYADSENLDLVMQTYSDGHHPYVFVVNDLRDAANRGVENPFELRIRDRAEQLQVIDIDTAEPLPAARGDDGWLVRDVLAPAWYKIYAVVPAGVDYAGPPPLQPGPSLKDLTAVAEAGGVRLRWQYDLDDWVGSDVQWLRVYRGSAAAATQCIDTLYAHRTSGPGGLITEYLDRTAKPGTACEYGVQVVTPLRVAGPLFEVQPERKADE